MLECRQIEIINQMINLRRMINSIKKVIRNNILDLEVLWFRITNRLSIIRTINQFHRNWIMNSWMIKVL